jgi:hypothetical protein
MSQQLAYLFAFFFFLPNKRSMRHHCRPRGLSSARFVIDHPAQSRKGAFVLVFRVLCASNNAMPLAACEWSWSADSVRATLRDFGSIPAVATNSPCEVFNIYCIQDYVSAQSGER